MIENNTTKELAAELTRIFPLYIYERDEYDLMDPSLHAVWLDFMDYFKTEQSAFNETQRLDLGDLINRCVDAGGRLENAVGTCFLEHLGQVGGVRALKPYLSADSKTRLRA